MSSANSQVASSSGAPTHWINHFAEAFSSSSTIVWLYVSSLTLLSFEELPIQALDRKEKVLRTKTILLVRNSLFIFFGMEESLNLN